MATVQAIIEAGYTRSAANAPGKTAIDAELIAHLNRLYHVLWSIMAASNPDAFQARITVTLAAGVGALPAQLIDIRSVRTAGGTKVHVAPVEELERGWHVAPVVVREGNTLVTRGRAGDPSVTQVLTLWVLAAPTDLTALGNVLDPRFPTRHELLLVTDLALYLALKDDARNPTEIQEIARERSALFDAFLQLSGFSMTVLESAHGAALLERVNRLAPMPGGK